jgi:CubicO group peptidase (beta-lactamase class C family)
MKKVYSLIIALVLTAACFAQDTPPFIKDSLDNYMNHGLQQWKIPGAAVCIVKDGKVVLVKGFGIREEGKDQKVDENTLFLIGSNTKAFTGTLMAELEQEKKLSLNDKVQKWLPEFKMKDEWISKEINLTDLLCHRMGLATFQGDFTYWGSDLSMDEVIKKFGMLTPKYSFRTTWGYTNAGFVTAGRVIEKITGKKWGEYLKEKILLPLEMNNTYPYITESEIISNKAAAHTLVQNKLVKIDYPHIDNIAPCGSIASSVSDLSKWLIALLDSGRYENKNVIPYSVIERTRRPESILRGGSNPLYRTPFAVYGLGWDVEDYHGNRIVSHTGGVDGFVTSVTLLPEQKLGVVVLTNTDANYFYEAAKWQVIDAYLKLPYNNYSTVYGGYQKQSDDHQNKWYAEKTDSVKLHLTPGISLDKFEGTYTHNIYGEVYIKKSGDGLEISFQHHPGLNGKLEYIGNNRFLCTYNIPTYGVKVFPFVIENNEVKQFTLSVADFLEMTTYNFVKNK